MKHKILVLGLLVGALIFTSACGMVNTLMSGRSAGTVNDLWDDVPRIDGLTKADMEMPLAARLALRAFSQGRMNFIAFTTTSTPQQVQEFYTIDRMNEAGWTTSETNGCMGEAEIAEVGTLCVFGKDDGSSQEILAIVAALDDATGETAVFYARIDTTEEQSTQ